MLRSVTSNLSWLLRWILAFLLSFYRRVCRSYSQHNRRAGGQNVFELHVRASIVKSNSGKILNNIEL